MTDASWVNLKKFFLYEHKPDSLHRKDSFKFKSWQKNVAWLKKDLFNYTERSSQLGRIERI